MSTAGYPNQNHLPTARQLGLAPRTLILSCEFAPPAEQSTRGKVGFGYDESEGGVRIIELAANKPEKNTFAPSAPPNQLKK